MPLILRWPFTVLIVVLATAITSFSAPMNNFAISEARTGTIRNPMHNQNRNIEEHSQSTHAAFQDHSNQVPSFNQPFNQHLSANGEVAHQDIRQRMNQAARQGRADDFEKLILQSDLSLNDIIQIRAQWMNSDVAEPIKNILNNALLHDMDYCIQHNDFTALEFIINEAKINPDYVIVRAMLNKNIQVMKYFAGNAKDLGLRQKYVQLAEETNDWSLLENLDLKGVQVSQIISNLVDADMSNLLRKVLDEGIYDAEALKANSDEFVMERSPLMKIKGQLKRHFESSMKDKKPEIVAEWVRLDLVDVKEVLQLSSTNKDFYNALVQNPTIQSRIIMNNDLDTIRSLIKKGSVRAEDILKEANEWENLYVSSSIVNPEILKQDLLKFVNSGKWNELTQMNLKNVNVDDLLDPKVISKLEKQPRVLRYLLSQGSFSLENVIQAKSELKPDSPVTSLLESAVDKSLSEIIFKRDIKQLSSLVEGKKIKLDRIMDLADEATLKSLVKTKAIQDNLFQSNDVDNVRLLASKDVLTVQEVINLAEKYRNRELKKEFENYQKNRIPFKVSLPQTVLHGKYQPVQKLSNGKWPPFESGNYPEVELKGKKFKPVKKLGQGADGQVVSYQNEQDPSEFIAVKIGLSQEPNYGYQTPQREELHLAKKNNLIKGKTAMLDGYSFTPMKLIRGEPYANIVKSEEFQRPDELLQQMNAVDKAIEEISKSGVEHRDLHFNNIMYDPITNKANVIDFGRSASSSVTDDNGQEFQLNPYADRKRVLIDMKRMLRHIEETNSELTKRYNYEPVENLLSEKLNNFNDDSDNEMHDPNISRSMQSSKEGEYEKLEKHAETVSSRNDWKELRQNSKQKKRLIRQIGTLAHENLLYSLGAKQNPKEIQKLYDAIDTEEYNADYVNVQQILELNRKWNANLAKAHEEFQLSKSNLKRMSESKKSSQSDGSTQENEPPSKRKKILG